MEENEVPEENSNNNSIPLYGDDGETIIAYTTIDSFQNGVLNGNQPDDEKEKVADTPVSYLTTELEKLGIELPEDFDQNELADLTQEEAQEFVEEKKFNQQLYKKSPLAAIMHEVGEEKFNEASTQFLTYKADIEKRINQPDNVLGKERLIDSVIQTNGEDFEMDENGRFTKESVDLINNMVAQKAKKLAKETGKTVDEVYEELGKEQKEDFKKYNPLNDIVAAYKEAKLKQQEQNIKHYEEVFVPQVARSVKLDEFLKRWDLEKEVSINPELESKFQSFITQQLSVDKNAKPNEPDVVLFNRLQKDQALLKKVLALTFMDEQKVFNNLSQSVKKSFLERLKLK
jgi:hypothetical protein